MWFFYSYTLTHIWLHLQRQESEKVPEEEVEPAAGLRIIKMSKTEWRHLLLGTIGAAINGAFPFVFAFLIGEMLGVGNLIFFV